MASFGHGNGWPGVRTPPTNSELNLALVISCVIMGELA